MSLILLSTKDCQALLEFETNNATFFETLIPPRPKQYFQYNTLLSIIKKQEIEQQNSECLRYLLYQNDKIIGRFNLNDIKGNTADLGYRLCQTAINKGIASKTVKQILHIAKNKYHLTTITASTSNVNKASIRVLEKNQFQFINKASKPILLNDQPIWLNHYKINLQSAPNI